MGHNDNTICNRQPPIAIRSRPWDIAVTICNRQSPIAIHTGPWDIVVTICKRRSPMSIRPRPWDIMVTICYKWLEENHHILIEVGRPRGPSTLVHFDFLLDIIKPNLWKVLRMWAVIWCQNRKAPQDGRYWWIIRDKILLEASQPKPLFLSGWLSPTNHLLALNISAPSVFLAGDHVDVTSEFALLKVTLADICSACLEDPMNTCVVNDSEHNVNELWNT